MRRKPKAPPYDLAAAQHVVAKHQAKKHFMEGGDGVCCFIYVNGGLFPGGSQNCLCLAHGFEHELSRVAGVTSVRVVLD